MLISGGRVGLGIRPPIGRLLVADWAPDRDEDGKILFVFDGGVLDAGTLAAITFADDELTGFDFYAVEDVDGQVSDRLGRRVKAAVTARERGETVYLEHGHVVAGT